MILAVLFLATAPLGDLSGYPEIAKYGPLPQDVRVLIDRRMQCDHWTGEEPYDRARRRQIDTAIRQLRCDTVEREEKRLERRYSNVPAVLKALTETRDWQ